MFAYFRHYLVFLVLILLVSTWVGLSNLAFAGPKPDDCPCPECCPCSTEDSQSTQALCAVKEGYSYLSFTEGNLMDSHPVLTLKSASGPTTDFHLFYNSFLADGSNFAANTVMGFGWTHSYNIFLTVYRMDVFKHGGHGRTKKFDSNPDGSYDSPEGTAETLVKNPDGTFDMRLKDGTVYHFEKLDPPPFLMPSPPYYVKSITDRNGKTTTFTYNSDSLLSQITDYCGRQVLFTYNANKKLETITDPLSRVTRLDYDPKGYKLLKITDPIGYTVEYTYNVRNQIIQKKDKDGDLFFYEYNGAGKPIRVKDGTGQVILNLSNPNNWAIDYRTLFLETKRRYIPSETTKTDGCGNVWKYNYNKYGYLTEVIAPDGCTTNYTYDPVTLNVATETDANGNTTSYEYDALGNRIKLILPDETPGDPTDNPTWTYTYDPVFSQMTSMTDPNGVITEYEYDANGNRIKETADVGGLNFTREWTYDADGNVLTEKDRNGNVTEYEYDAVGNLITITDPLNCVTTMTYDAVGNLISRTDGNNHTTTYEYDGLDRLIRETDPLLGVTEYVYDGKGNRRKDIESNNQPTE